MSSSDSSELSILGRIADGLDGPAIRGSCFGVLIEPPQQVGFLKRRGDSFDAVGITLPRYVEIVQRRMACRSSTESIRR